MVLDIALERYDNTTPFGFKLIGGADFDVPLQVVKVSDYQQKHNYLCKWTDISLKK